jgi:uncharacterized membrane protein YczE
MGAEQEGEIMRRNTSKDWRHKTLFTYHLGKKTIVLRYIIFVLGLFVMALGISLITKASLGTSPISSIPYVLSFRFNLTFGQLTFILNMGFILLELLLLKKDFQKKQYFQIIVAVLFSFFVDVSMGILSPLHPERYFKKIIFLLIGCAMLALGTRVQIMMNVIINSGEGIVKAIAFKTGLEFGTIKILFDCTLVSIALAASFAFLGEVRGIREGTFVSALMVGFLTKCYKKICPFSF